MGTVAGAVAVVRSTVELGRSLDLFVVAEGVERDDQRLALWEMGCPAGQGHLFARPMPIDALLDLLDPGVGRGARPPLPAGARRRRERDRPAPARPSRTSPAGDAERMRAATADRLTRRCRGAGTRGRRLGRVGRTDREERA